MKEQKDLKIIKIEDIMINPENPRHNQVQMVMPEIGEQIIMKELIRDRATANKMFDLIKSIFESGFIPSLAVILEYREDIKKYIPWDGNRRITALKILKNPSVMKDLRYFTIPQITTISEFSKKVQQDFFEVSAYIVQNFEEAAPMIKAIHTTASGALQWDRIMIKRFEQKLNVKNILAQAVELLPSVFKELPDNFPTTVLDKILESKEGKKFLEIDNIDYTLTFTSSMDETEEKLKNIVEDIKSGKINTKTVQSNKKIKEYLNCYEDTTEEFQELADKNKKTKNSENLKTKLDLPKLDNKEATQIELAELQTQTELKPELHIKREDIIAFANININNLDFTNERARRIKKMACEMQNFSRRKDYKYYPIAYCFSLRALLEQTSIYFLINKSKWEELKKGKNRDLNLGEIIKYITNNADNLFWDNVNMKKIWKIVFNSESSKDYLDLVIHQPYDVDSNIEYIKTISDIGMFAIIQYFINERRIEKI